ncbi:MAG: glycosyltransferase [Gammaproteobacteria bacterium]|nr:glycosyltransferase [Gammaproteobacteria bacterium]
MINIAMNKMEATKRDSSRYAFFLPSLHGGGAERVTVNLLKGLDALGVPLDLVLVKAEGTYLTDVPNNVRLIDLKSARVIACVPRLIRYLRRERPAVLISAMVQSNIVALLARRLARVDTKLAVVEHSTLSRLSTQSASRNAWLMPFLARCTYPWADGVVSVSNGVADDLSSVVNIAREKINVIYNPVVREEIFKFAQKPIEDKWLLDQKIPVIMAVGRLSRAKDYPTLINAFSELKKRRNANLIILGEGEERQALELLIKELGLESCVLLPGFVSNPYAYLSRARLFVLSSRWEGLPTVLIEALALGVPVVATDCMSGPREILDNGRHGPLVPVGNVPALASQMEALLDATPYKIPREAWMDFSEEVAVANYLKFMRTL